jgi:hypothetical protein
MRVRVARKAALCFLTVLLAGLSWTAGCGNGKDTSRAVVKYGLLWDFTGIASLAMRETYDGLKAYLDVIEAEDPIPGAQIELVTYDTKLDPARIPAGYMWLKGKESSVIATNPEDAQMLRRNFEEDGIPFLDATNLLSTIGSDWLFSMYGPVEGEIETLMNWIADSWNQYPTKPRVGFVGFAGRAYSNSQLDQARLVCESYPDKYEWTGAQMAPSSTVTWAVEISRILGNDFTIVGLSGPPLVSFTKEAIDRGYTNTLAGSMASFMTFWKLLTDTVPSDQLDHVYCASYYPSWDDDVPFIAQMKRNCEEVLSLAEREVIYLGTGRMGGWAMGIIIVDAVRRAAEKVGPESIDCSVLRDALAETDLDMEAEGWGNRWKLSGGTNCFARAVRMYEYSVTDNKWSHVSDWYAPPCLQD